MFFDAAFCSLLICFFSEAVSVPPLALRSATTCLLMFFCWFSALAASPAVICPLLMPWATRSCWFSWGCATVGLGFSAGAAAGVAAGAGGGCCEPEDD